jgi:ferredoxin
MDLNRQQTIQYRWADSLNHRHCDDDAKMKQKAMGTCYTDCIIIVRKW